MVDDVGALLVKLQADVAQLKSDLQSGRNELASFKSDAEGFGDSMMSAFKWGAAIVGVYELGSAIKSAFQQGIQAVDDFKLTTIGISATITDLAVDQSKGQENYNQALAYSKDMYQELELAAARYFASGQEMVAAWNIMAQKGVVLRKEEIDSLGIIVDRIKLSTQGQVSSMQIAQELRAILTGQARATDQVAMLLKDKLGPAWEDIVKNVKETGSLKPLADQFQGLAFASKDIEGTLESQRSTLGTILTQIGRSGLGGAYEDITGWLKEANDYLMKHRAEIGENIAAAWETVKAVIADVAAGIKGIYEAVAKPIRIVVELVKPGVGAFNEMMKDDLESAVLAGGGFGLGAGRVPPRREPTIATERGGFIPVAPEIPLIGYGSEDYGHVPDTTPPKTKMGGGGGGKGGGGGADKSRVASWQAELDEMKEAENAYFNFSKDRELQFWQEKLALVEKGSSEETQLRHKIFAAKKELARQELQEEIANLKLKQQSAKLDGDQRIAIQQQIMNRIADTYGKDSKEFKDAEREKVKITQQVEAQRVKIAEDAIQKLAEFRKIDLDIQREDVNFRRQMGVLTAAQEIAQLIKLKQQEYQIDKKSIDDRLLLLKKYGMEQTKEYSELIEKRKLLEQKQTLDLKKLNNQRMLALKQQWQQLWDSVSRAFTMSLQGIIQGTTTLKDALSNIFQSILSSFIEMVLQMAMQWIAAQLMMLIFGESAAKTKAAMEITGEAGIAGAAGVASVMMAVPFPANIELAPVIGKLASGMALGFLPSAAAAGGWWEVPGVVSTMLHPKEMVLPAWAAEGLRGMVGQGGQGPASGPQQVTNVYLKAFDSIDAARAFKKYGNEVGDSLHGPARNYRGQRSWRRF